MKLKKWKLFFSVIVLYLAVSAVIIFWGRGCFHRNIVFISLVVFVGIPLIAVSLLGTIVTLILGWRNSRSVFLKSLAASLVFVSLMVPLYMAYYVADYDVGVAKSFCEQLVPELERIKSEAGRYPETIDGLIADKKLPALLEDETFYYSDGTSFDFTVTDCSTMMSGWNYCNSDPVWEYYD